MENPLIQPISSRNSSVINVLVEQRKKGKKKTSLILQKDSITIILVITPFLLVERNRGMMTTSKESLER